MRILPHQNTIQSKFTVPVIIAVVLLSLIGNVVRVQVDQGTRLQELKRKVSLTADLSATALADDLWTINIDGVQGTCSAFYKDPEIGFLSVQDMSRSILYSKRKTGPLYQDNDLLYITWPVVREGTVLGHVRAGITQAYVLRQTRRDLATSSIIILAVAAITFLLIRMSALWVTRPIAGIREALDEIGRGNLSFRVTRIPSDEIGQVARGVNAMADNLTEMIEHRRRAEQALQKAHDDLEYTVMIRTQEITAANQELLAMNQELQTVNESLAEEIAERERAETNLAGANRELRIALDRLQQTQNELVRSEKMASLGTLVAGVAHEINTPVGIGLTAITNLGELMTDVEKQFEVNSLKRSDFKHFLENCRMASSIIESNLGRASDLIRSFKQVSVDQLTESRREFDLKWYLQQVVTSLEPKIRQAGHHVELVCPEGVEIDSYPGTFAQIMTNLFMNSILHAFDPGQAGELRLEAGVTESELCLQYSDDGRGMNSETRQKIFEPFFTTRRGAGFSGLGMHIVYNLVAIQLGGTINLTSEIGLGTRFDIRIPIESAGANLRTR